MIDNIKKVLKKEDGVLVFNSEGRLVKLDFDEYKVFDKYGKLVSFPKNINSNEKRVVELLCDLNMMRYKNYIPKKVKKNYGQKLYFADSEESIYDAPVLAHIAVTDKCNMQCKYCSVRQAHGRIKNKELTTKQWKKIIKHLSDCGVFQIGFTGGEPTLRKDIHELMRFTESIGCVCNLTTNGWFLSEDFVKEMAATGIKQCQISLDSFNERIHDGLRGEGSLKRVLSAIKLLQRYGIAVGIDCVVSTNNVKDIPTMIKKCLMKFS
jgi:MoaA/NifB/PqqE/SkfB family radical SAM enzyme